MTEYEQRRLFWTRLGALGTLGCFLVVALLGLSVGGRLRQAGAVMNSLESISAQLESVDWKTVALGMDNVAAQLESADLTEIMNRLDAVSLTLSAIDWSALALQVDGVTVSARSSLDQAQRGMDEALQTLEALDIEALNAAVGEFRTVVTPLAQLAARWQK